MDKYNRSKFYKTVVVNRILENDLSTNTISKFEFKREKEVYTVKEEDIARPDIISFNIYGKVNFWWIILKLNNIEDVWHDLYAGQTILVPDKTDIEEFYLNNKQRNK